MARFPTTPLALALLACERGAPVNANGSAGASSNSGAPAAEAVGATEAEGFVMTRTLVPMRDGVRLETAIFAPKDARRALPILLVRTPYGIPAGTTTVAGEWYAPLRADGYIFVFQNLRGRFGSEGQFVMERPARDAADPNAIDETTDAWDSIEWLVSHVPNNTGKVGLLGGSYSALTATLALLEPHPALKVISEAASPADQFLGDDLHHNGAFRLDYAFEFSAYLEQSTQENTRFRFDRTDLYDWFLELGPLSNVDARHFHGLLPSWNALVAHPNHDAYWQSKSLGSLLTRASVPILNVAGAWDQEDYYGPLTIYERLQRHDTAGINRLVIGPWSHDGWSGPGRSLGPIDFGSDTGTYYRQNVQAPWLAHWLHGAPLSAPEARVFVTGQNEWREFERWPPTKGVTPTRLYLREGRRLAFEPPEDDGPGAADEYVSDPASPVPYMPRPIGSIFQDHEAWSAWQVVDQRFAEARPDVLTWQSDVLEHDITIAGDIVAELYAATTGSDSDWVVKLIDAYPDGPAPIPGASGTSGATGAAKNLRGYQLMIAGEVMRGRFRESFSEPVPLARGEVLPYTFSLRQHAHAFLKGHRIMVQIQSSWFPLIDRNPQTFVPNIFLATTSDYVSATQRVARARSAATAIVLPVLTGRTDASD